MVTCKQLLMQQSDFSGTECVHLRQARKNAPMCAGILLKNNYISGIKRAALHLLKTYLILTTQET
jgi:hypothetical protein